MKLALLTVCVVFALFASLDTVVGECCSPQYFGSCDDGTSGTPCCAYGGCNMFCCNCDNGCRKGGRDDSGASVDGFQLIDTDKDGRVSLAEARGHVQSGACGNATERIDLVSAEFARMDLDLDGFLTKAEIDS